MTPFEAADLKAWNFGACMLFCLAFQELVERDRETDRAMLDLTLPTDVRREIHRTKKMLLAAFIEAGTAREQIAHISA